MKRFVNVTMLTLAMNFLLMAGGVGYLFKSGKLTKEKVHDIRELVFAPPPVDPATTQSADGATTQPTLRLEELLAKKAGLTGAQQVDYIQQAFDAQMVQLDRRQREVEDLQRQVEIAKQQMARDRAALESAEKDLQARQEQAARLASDQGFQDSLALLESMPAKSAKVLCLGMSDEVLVQYLQSMSAGARKKIIKEFKSAEELERIQRITDRMREAQASTKE